MRVLLVVQYVFLAVVVVAVLALLLRTFIVGLASTHTTRTWKEDEGFVSKLN